MPRAAYLVLPAGPALVAAAVDGSSEQQGDGQAHDGGDQRRAEPVSGLVVPELLVGQHDVVDPGLYNGRTDPNIALRLLLWDGGRVGMDSVCPHMLPCGHFWHPARCQFLPIPLGLALLLDSCPPCWKQLGFGTTHIPPFTESWTCAKGKGRHSGPPSPAPLLPNGQVICSHR